MDEQSSQQRIDRRMAGKDGRRRMKQGGGVVAMAGTKHLLGVNESGSYSFFHGDARQAFV